MAGKKKEAAKEAATEAIGKVKAAAEDVKATVKAVAETAAEKTETVVEKAKKAAATKTPAPKTRRTTKKAAETTAEKIETKVVIELPNVSESSDVLIERAKADWTAKGNALEDVKQLTLYINAAESMVYYVVNDEYSSGSFAI